MLEEDWQDDSADDAVVPLTEVLGEKLPRRLARRVSQEQYRLLCECRPFGEKRVKQVAQELGLPEKQIYRWVHSCRLRLEFELLTMMPQRAIGILQHGRLLREEGSKFESAEKYLGRLAKRLDGLALPEGLLRQLNAECNLELGHICRDRGSADRRWLGIQRYMKAQAAFTEWEGESGGSWRNATATCGRLVPKQAFRWRRSWDDQRKTRNPPAIPGVSGVV